jgi:DNA-binding NarL/FixJ family response regulator
MENELTPRQHAVAELVAQGHTNKVIAHLLGISEGTVKVHLSDTFARLGISNRTALAMRVRLQDG